MQGLEILRNGRYSQQDVSDNRGILFLATVCGIYTHISLTVEHRPALMGWRSSWCLAPETREDEAKNFSPFFMNMMFTDKCRSAAWMAHVSLATPLIPVDALQTLLSSLIRKLSYFIQTRTLRIVDHGSLVCAKSREYEYVLLLQEWLILTDSLSCPWCFVPVCYVHAILFPGARSHLGNWASIVKQALGSIPKQSVIRATKWRFSGDWRR
jgi:hypothetical protein